MLNEEKWDGRALQAGDWREGNGSGTEGELEKGICIEKKNRISAGSRQSRFFFSPKNTEKAIRGM